MRRYSNNILRSNGTNILRNWMLQCWLGFPFATTLMTGTSQTDTRLCPNKATLTSFNKSSTTPTSLLKSI